MIFVNHAEIIINHVQVLSNYAETISNCVEIITILCFSCKYAVKRVRHVYSYVDIITIMWT